MDSPPRRGCNHATTTPLTERASGAHPAADGLTQGACLGEAPAADVVRCDPSPVGRLRRISSRSPVGRHARVHNLANASSTRAGVSADRLARPAYFTSRSRPVRTS